MSGIRIFSKWGDPREQAKTEQSIELAKRFGATEDDTPHGLHPNMINQLDYAAGRRGLVGAPAEYRRSFVQDLLPEGRTVEARRTGNWGYGNPGSWAGAGGGSPNNSLFTAMKPYQPEFASPDRQMFPIHRRLANSYWRLFYKMDPVIGTIIDLFSDLPWSDFQLVGEGVEGEIKEQMEFMLKEVKMRSILPAMVREYFIVGEVVPHLYYDDNLGCWTYCALHNPDQINVVHSPFIKMDTLMEFVPDSRLKELATSSHPMLARIRESMPSELVARLRNGQNIPLSPVNASFIPRKLHPYDLRGTSIITRLWRTLMLEDAIWSATIATARRAASPIKVAKLGDPTTGVLPTPEEESKVLRLLAEAEADPQAWLVYSYQLQFELAGAPERVMSINQHYDLIERIKLAALGVSKSFISGETSYSSSAAGLTIFLQRLKALREFFVSEWLIPKFFLPVAIMNNWVKTDKASEGQFRIKRSFKDLHDESRYIVPEIEWEKSLDPTVDQERIQAMQALEQGLGIKISDQKKYACVGLEPEEEQKQIVEEMKFKKNLAGKDPLMQVAVGLLPPDALAGGGMAGGGGMMSPGIPPDAFGMPGGEGEDLGGGEAPPDAGVPPEGASKESESGSNSQSPNDKLQPNSYASKHWAESVLRPLTQVFDSFDLSELDGEEPWSDMVKDPEVVHATQMQDPRELWQAIEGWLIDKDYPTDAIEDLSRTLTGLGKLKTAQLFEDPAKFAQMASQLGVTIDESPESIGLFVGSKK